MNKKIPTTVKNTHTAYLHITHRASVMIDVSAMNNEQSINCEKNAGMVQMNCNQ